MPENNKIDYSYLLQDTQPSMTKKSSLAEVAEASFILSAEQTEVASISTLIRNNFIDEKEDDLISADEANSIHRLPTPINKPISKNLFDNMVKRDIERKKYKEVLANGQGGLIEGVVSFGAGAIPQVIDPVGLASGFGVSTMATKMLGKGALFGGKIGQNIAEGVVGNLISEAAFVIPASLSDQQEIDSAQSLQNAMIGGIAFPAAIAGLGLGLKKTIDLMNVVEQRMANGKKPMGTLHGNEVITGKAIEALDARAEELRSLAQKPEADIESIRAELDEISSNKALLEEELQQHKRIREMENSPENNMYYDNEMAREFQDIQNNVQPESPDLKTKTDEIYEEALLDDITDTQRIEIENDRAILEDRRSKASEITKAISVCMRGK